MPDILKVTTPLVNKNQPISPRLNVEGPNAFNIQDTSKVIKSHNQSEILKNNTNTLEGGETPTLLLNLLKDPAVAVSYLKNITLLEEIFRLLPANNNTRTPEIEQLFNAFSTQPEDISTELLRQEHGTTSFKGEIFDLLRSIVDDFDTPEVNRAVANYLKALNGMMNKADIKDAVSNALVYLRSSLSSSGSLSQKLDALISAFKQGGDDFPFSQLKEQTLAIFREVEDSLLFSPKLSKVVSITIYNLSRYNDNPDFFSEMTYRLRQLLPNPQRQQLTEMSQRILRSLTSGTPLNGTDPALMRSSDNSAVMNALIELVSLQSLNTDLNPADADKVDKIIHSLLSSPCNFTPLLHFIAPVSHDGMRAFAEIWINPRSDERDMPGMEQGGIHLLVVVDVESVGRFEVELFVRSNIVDLHLYCPAGYEGQYAEMMGNLPSIFKDTSYRLGSAKLDTARDETRSLMEVFKSLPYKRVGVDVTI